ncbi:MAG: type VI secretion system protein TssA [Herminiimonas sp.]|nr:type VI secretion system protein TssA [Herminiimonas sp.]
MNIERWTAALSAQSPCGEDLEYDEQFMALARAVVGKPEQQYGDTVIAAEKPDWREVERVADELMMRTKDVRVCVLLIRALTQNQGAPGLAAGLGAMHALLKQHWDDIHPRLRLEGEDDPYMRISAIAELAHVPGLIRDIRHVVLIKTPIGPILVKEAENVLENGLSESGVSRQQLLGLAGDAWRESQPSLLGFNEARVMLGLIATLCTEKFGERQSPDLSPLTSLLARLTAVLPRAPVADHESETLAAVRPAPWLGVAKAQQLGDIDQISQISCRQDVIRVLDAACRYLEENEPSNPAPLLIKRAQRLMTLDFLEIMMDLAPDSLGQVSLVTGTRPN